MKLGDRRRLMIAGVVVVVACSAALAFHFVGGGNDAGSDLVGLAPRTAVSADEDVETTAERTFEDYAVVSKRNVFSPLVSPPSDVAALTVPQDMPSPRSSSGEASRGDPPDPTRNLALTGVVESNSGLLALIRDIDTGKSVYAGVGDEAFNLRVASIDAKTITLARDDREYRIKMGEKDIPDIESASSSGAAITPGASGSPQADASRGPGGGPPTGRFGSSDMMRRLEENRSRMTAEQYDRARRYLQMRSSGGSSGGYRGGGSSRGRGR